MTHSAAQPPAGWYPDPAGSGDERYWDGGAWSQVTRPTGGVNVPVGAGAVHHGAAPGPGQAGPVPGHGARSPYAMPMNPALRLAGWWWRVLAAVIDALVFLVPLGIVDSLVLGPVMPELENWLFDTLAAAESGSAVVPAFPDAVLSAFIVYTFVTMLLWAAYRTLMVGRFGATLGQMATGLRVVRDGDSSLGRIGWGPSAGRAVLAVVLQHVPLVGFVNVLLPAFTAKKQTLHDMAVKTVVVKIK